MKRSALVWVILVVVIVLGGGGLLLANRNSNSNDTTSTTNSDSSQDMDMPSQQSSDSKPTATNSVTIADMAFSPANVTVKKGTTVTWTNNDSISHTVTENDSQDGPDSGNLAAGKSYSFTYNTAGTFKYHCAIHPDMTGTVTVTE